MAEEKKKRGRPAKKIEPKLEPKIEPAKEESKPVYAHDNRRRCDAPNRGYPAFTGVRCGGIMRAVSTYADGRLKRWQCPDCNAVRVTEGKEI